MQQQKRTWAAVGVEKTTGARYRKKVRLERLRSMADDWYWIMMSGKVSRVWLQEKDGSKETDV